VEKKEKIYLGIFSILILIFIYILSQANIDNKADNVHPEKPSEIKSINFINVEIIGEVKRTGVFYIPENFKINDLIVFAGGVTEFADLSLVNLDRKIIANEKVIIPSINTFDKPDENICGKSSNKICVVVTGAIHFPATYVIRKGLTIGDVVFMAGGVTEEIDLLALESVKDIVLNENISLVVKSKNVEESKLINLNKATLEELITLPNVGRVTATNIIAYRLENGLFQTIEEIMNVPGIGKATFDRIKNFITV